MKQKKTWAKFYKAYYGARSRCRNPKAPNYYKYGAKGIAFEWDTFEEFKRDMYEPYLEHIKEHGIKNTTIDRIDSSKNYNKDNCRWATYQVQNLNRKVGRFITLWGETKTVTDWCKKFNINRNVVFQRISIHDWDMKVALTTPVRRKRHV